MKRGGLNTRWVDLIQEVTAVSFARSKQNLIEKTKWLGTGGSRKRQSPCDAAGLQGIFEFSNSYSLL